MNNQELDKKYGSNKLNALERELETAKSEDVLKIIQEIIEEETKIYGYSPTSNEMEM